MNFEHLTTLVTKDIAQNNVPFLVGEPGIGKSSWAESLAEKLNTKVFVLAVNQLAEKADLTGCRLVPVGKTKNGEQEYAQMFYPHIVIRNAIDYATNHTDETPILFLDEINRTTPDVTSEVLSIPTLRSIGDRPIPDNLKIIVAGNDKGNVCSLDKASITRFVKYNMEPDINTFMTVNPELNKYVKAVLKKNPEYLVQNTISLSKESNENDNDNPEEMMFELEFDSNEDMEQVTVPRTITSVSKWLNACTEYELVNMINTIVDKDNSLLYEAITAHCGDTAFSFALVNEIYEDLNNKPVKNTAPIITITEPDKYQELISFTTRDELNNYISNLTNEEMSELLVYSLYDTRDNSNIISCMAPVIKTLNKKDTQILSAVKLNDANYATLCSIDCPITNLLTLIGI